MNKIRIRIKTEAKPALESSENEIILSFINPFLAREAKKTPVIKNVLEKITMPGTETTEKVHKYIKPRKEDTET